MLLSQSIYVGQEALLARLDSFLQRVGSQLPLLLSNADPNRGFNLHLPTLKLNQALRIEPRLV